MLTTGFSPWIKKICRHVGLLMIGEMLVSQPTYSKTLLVQVNHLHSQFFDKPKLKNQKQDCQ